MHRSSSHVSARYGRQIAFVLLVSLVCTAGCNGTKSWFRSTSEDYTLALPEDLSTSPPDERREAVVRLAESHRVDSEATYQVLDAVARTDPLSQIRCIAIRALGQYEDDRPFATLQTILKATDESTDALPGDDDVRWEATVAMVALIQQGLLPDASRDAVRDLLIRLLDEDPSRNVKLSAIEGLGCIHDNAVFSPLIYALRSKDFAIASQAERALIALTGVTHHCDPDAWETWVANAQTPFANAGHIPEDAIGEKPGWMENQRRKWRRFLKLGPREKS
jgi:hypothetical protein